MWETLWKEQVERFTRKSFGAVLPAGPCFLCESACRKPRPHSGVCPPRSCGVRSTAAPGSATEGWHLAQVGLVGGQEAS